MSFSKSDYCDEIFENINISESNISSIEFDNCIFKSCSFHKATLEFCKFIECSFEDCDLSLMKIKGSVFNDIQILNSKAIGINWSVSGQPFEISFNNSNISMSSFYNLDLRQVQIISCEAHEIDFAKTNLEKANFNNTDLLNSTFGDTNLKKANLSGARNYMIHPHMNNLKETKVSLPEAVSFLKFLGLNIVK